MKKIIILASSIAAILVVTITILVVMFVDFDKPSRNATSKYDDELVESVGNFTAVTAGNILNKQENVCYSPASLYVALCVASELMTDDAGKEVLTSLKYDNLEHMENGYKELIERIIPPASRDVVVNIVNSIWIQEEAKNYDSEEFIDSCSKKIPMEIFVKEFDKKEVNEWISDKTNGLIKEAVEEAESFHLINTTYFKGAWGDEFTLKDEDDFKLDSGEKIKVEYMESSYEDMYVRGKEYLAVEKNYMDNSKMIFVLPDQNKKLSELSNKEIINEIIASFSNDEARKDAEITLKMPKFKTSCDIESEDMKKSLEEAGIKGVFDVSSWSNIVDALYVWKIGISQTTRISVDEEGTEAAASTTISGIDWGVEEEEELIKINMTLDRPFMYIITSDDIPLFIGTVYNPTEG